MKTRKADIEECLSILRDGDGCARKGSSPQQPTTGDRKNVDEKKDSLLIYNISDNNNNNEKIVSTDKGLL